MGERQRERERHTHRQTEKKTVIWFRDRKTDSKWAKILSQTNRKEIKVIQGECVF